MLDVGNSHQFLSLNTISDVSITMLPTYSLGDTQTASRGNMSGDNRVIMPTDRGLQEFDCLNFSHHQLIPDTVTTQKVTCVSLMDNNHVLVGHQNGSCLVLKKGPLDCWCVHKRFQHNDRAITDCVLIENSIVVSSEDRKLLMINLQSGLVEFQVLRTIITKIGLSRQDLRQLYEQVPERLFCGWLSRWPIEVVEAREEWIQDLNQDCENDHHNKGSCMNTNNEYRSNAYNWLPFNTILWLWGESIKDLKFTILRLVCSLDPT